MGATRRWIEQLRNFEMKSCKKMLIPSNDYGIVYHNLTNETVRGLSGRGRFAGDLLVHFVESGEKAKKERKINLFPCFFWDERVYFHLLIIC